MPPVPFTAPLNDTFVGCGVLAGEIAMENTLLTVGLACIVAAIVGGGLKAFGLEIPLLRTLPRQLVLGAFGVVLLVISMQIKPKPPVPTQPQAPKREAIVQYAQRGGPFVMLGDKGRSPQPGYWWNEIAISFENHCSERLYVQPSDFRLYVSSRATPDGVKSFYPETTESYPGRLVATWVEPGATLEGRLVFEVPEKLADGTASNGSYHIIRQYSQNTCPLVYKPY
jgi:hypothetical protein